MCGVVFPYAVTEGRGTINAARLAERQVQARCQLTLRFSWQRA
jgi:hypothetical protein